MRSSIPYNHRINLKERGIVKPVDFVLHLETYNYLTDFTLGGKPRGTRPNPPIENKRAFLQNCFNSIPKNGYICIAEGFLSSMDISDEELHSLWKQRGKEAYSSTFWASLDSLNEQSISKAKRIGEFSQEYETRAGENVVSRDGEYLVSYEWLEQTGKEVGFKIILSEPCNSLGERVVLLQKI